MKLRRIVVALALTALLTACGGGPVKRINPPTASIQELSVQADGTWRLLIRVQNYSTVPMTFSSVTAHVSINDTDVGELSVSPNLEIVGESADIVTTTIKPNLKLPAGDFGYQLKGTIITSEPSKDFEFDRSSRLSPVPGLPNTWR
ncbi:MAG: hypothetical protein ABI451_03115 [Dokdonella sp.]